MRSHRELAMPLFAWSSMTSMLNMKMSLGSRAAPMSLSHADWSEKSVRISRAFSDVGMLTVSGVMQWPNERALASLAPGCSTEGPTSHSR